MSLRRSPHSSGNKPAANPRAPPAWLPWRQTRRFLNTVKSSWASWEALASSLPSSCRTRIFLEKRRVSSGTVWLRRGREDGVWAEGVRFGLGGGGSAGDAACMTMRLAGFVNCCVVGPLQATELKTHTTVYPQLAWGWFIHCARWWVTCCIETIPS